MILPAALEVNLPWDAAAVIIGMLIVLGILILFVILYQRVKP